MFIFRALCKKYFWSVFQYLINDYCTCQVRRRPCQLLQLIIMIFLHAKMLSIKYILYSLLHEFTHTVWCKKNISLPISYLKTFFNIHLIYSFICLIIIIYQNSKERKHSVKLGFYLEHFFEILIILYSLTLRYLH